MLDRHLAEQIDGFQLSISSSDPANGTSVSQNPSKTSRPESKQTKLKENLLYQRLRFSGQFVRYHFIISEEMRLRRTVPMSRYVHHEVLGHASSV